MNELKTKLQELCAGGAALHYVLETAPRPLAAAHFTAGDGELWFCQIWPADDFDQHWLDFARAEIDGANINFHNFGGLVATIAPLEDEERRACQWDRWISATDPEAVRGRAFVKRLEEEAMHQEGLH